MILSRKAPVQRNAGGPQQLIDLMLHDLHRLFTRDRIEIEEDADGGFTGWSLALREKSRNGRPCGQYEHPGHGWILPHVKLDTARDVLKSADRFLRTPVESLAHFGRKHFGTQRFLQE